LLLFGSAIIYNLYSYIYFPIVIKYKRIVESAYYVSKIDALI